MSRAIPAALLLGLAQINLASTEKERLDAAVDRALKENRLVGTVVLVARDGKVVYQRAAGYADREAGETMTLDHVFRLASMSKLLTSMAALVLAEQGKLSLDDSVDKWIPTFQPRMADGSRPTITVRHLITHTAGLSYRFSEPIGGPYEQANVSDGLDQPGLSMDENLRRIASVPLSFEPGSKWQYSVSIDVLGAVISRAAGKPLPQVIQDCVTKPLRMNGTGFSPPGNRLVAAYADGANGPVRMEEGHRIVFGPRGVTFSLRRDKDVNSFPAGGAGAYGTTSDYLKFLEALRTHDFPGMRQETIRQVVTNQVGDMMGKTWSFGLGVGILMDPAAIGSPQSVGTYRWGGVLGTSWFVDPKKNLTVIIMSNTATEGLNGPFTRWVRDAVYGKD